MKNARSLLDAFGREQLLAEYVGIKPLATRPNFFLRSSRISIDLLLLESKTTDKLKQYDWQGREKFGRVPTSRGVCVTNRRYIRKKCVIKIEVGGWIYPLIFFPAITLVF